MFRALVSGIALVVTSAAATTRAPAAFSLVLESTPTGWAARCDSGCRWHELSFNCERACGAIVDANGVVTLATPQLDQAAFRFIVERTAAEVRATARTGTAWKTLSWGCQLDRCRARVDGYGVSLIAGTR
ncbi:MAG TPA: hypothetical protein VGQ44_06225 [Gemmatimonadaceae bacterium]|jgi:hypothetical protein|nr:hypothetical protein [Gemmatimonadaceae bacterium]